jgi:hypothetical protein
MPAGNTYEAIATQTLGSTAASVTFSSIPSTYTDLVIVFDGLASASQTFSIQFNGDTGSNYSNTALGGDGSSAFSTRNSNVTAAIMGINYSTGRSNFILNIMNYSNSTTNKTALCRSNNANGETNARVGLWRNTATVTSLLIKMDSTATFSSGSTFSLYGIASA